LEELEEFNSFNCEWQCDIMLKDLKIFSQNVRKNNIIINTILEVNHDFDIIFIQKPSWTTIRSIPSLKNCEDISLIGVTNHPN